GRRGRRAPAKTMSPLLRTVAEIARRVVVLPAPFAPRTATISPSPTTRSIPCKACNGPYRAATPRSSSRGMLGPLAAQISLDHGGVPPPPRGRPPGDLAPEVEDVNAVGDAHDETHVVLDQQDRQLERRSDPPDQARELPDLLVAEPAGGLVEQQQPRSRGGGPGEHDPHHRSD